MAELTYFWCISDTEPCTENQKNISDVLKQAICVTLLSKDFFLSQNVITAKVTKIGTLSLALVSLKQIIRLKKEIIES